MHLLLHSVPPALQQATTNPCLCWRLLDIPGQVWVSLLWGQCSFLLGPGVHKVLFVPSKCLFFQSYVSSGSSMVGLMFASSKRAYSIPRSTASRAPGPTAPAAVHCWRIQTQFFLNLCGVSGSWCTQSMFELSEHLWQAWGLILNAFSPLLPSCWGLSFALGCGVKEKPNAITLRQPRDLQPLLPV